ncbi:MAG: SDR family oxidoreductase [Alphaproteobacteria bacterium]|nr:SDR family oxidoreductase [Alphaproteobacteria bacterium]
MGKAKRLEGKVAIVTGGAHGIGKAIARRLGEEGADVIIGDIDGAAANNAADDMSGAIAMALDITQQDQIDAVVRDVEKRFGRLDILVNNAAILDIAPFDRLTYERFSEVLRVNLDGALLCCLAAAPVLAISGGGRILNIASIMGIAGSKDAIPYSTAKGGIVNLTRCLACDLASKNITVNAIAPGFIDTRMARLEDGSHEHDTDYFKTVYLKHEKIPIGRAGQPDDIAGPAFFLCSDDSRYVTGQIIAVDGGVTMTF